MVSISNPSLDLRLPATSLGVAFYSKQTKDAERSLHGHTSLPGHTSPWPHLSIATSPWYHGHTSP